jgi:hypothetical protein
MRDMSSGLRARALAAAVAAALALALMAPGAAAAWGLTKKGTVVSYDRRSLMIDGRREIFFSGAIHYPRSPPDMWPNLIAKAKEGGLNAIESYVFWNIHEPQQGVVIHPAPHMYICISHIYLLLLPFMRRPTSFSLQLNFEGRYDMIKFFKMIQEHDMYAIVRIGPFIQAEWNHGFVCVPSSSRSLHFSSPQNHV